MTLDRVVADLYIMMYIVNVMIVDMVEGMATTIQDTHSLFS